MSRQIGSVAQILGLATPGMRVDLKPLVSETDQTAQSDRRVENKGRFAPLPARKPTALHPKLTSGPVQCRLAGAPTPCLQRP